MNEPTPFQLLEVCEEAARTAGLYALENLHRRTEVAENFDHDVKLVLDSECQRLIEGIIHHRFPDHAILGEEGSLASGHDCEWIIDPIDGTANYARAFPYWCCSVAVRRDGETAAACVFVPPFDECYTAAVNGPALCNGEPLKPSSKKLLSESVLFTGLTKDIHPASLAFFADAAPKVSKIRISGSAAVDVCHVACGRSDIYYESGLYLWDIAAAGLIAERAGAVCREWSRDEKYGVRFLCANRSIFSAAEKLVEKHAPEQPG